MADGATHDLDEAKYHLLLLTALNSIITVLML